MDAFECFLNSGNIATPSHLGLIEIERNPFGGYVPVPVIRAIIPETVVQESRRCGSCRQTMVLGILLFYAENGATGT